LGQNESVYERNRLCRIYYKHTNVVVLQYVAGLCVIFFNSNKNYPFIVEILNLSQFRLYYLGNSFRSPVPWSNCDNSWNTKSCYSTSALNRSLGNMTNATITRNDLPATEYFTRHLLGAHRSNGFDDLVGIKPDLLLCVFIIFLLTTGNFTSVTFYSISEWLYVLPQNIIVKYKISGFAGRSEKLVLMVFKVIRLWSDWW